MSWDVELGDVELGDVELGDVEPGLVEPGLVEPGLQSRMRQCAQVRVQELAAQLVLEPKELRLLAEVLRQNGPGSPQLGAQQTGSSRFDWFHSTP